MKSLLLICLFALPVLAMDFEGEARKYVENGVFTCPSTGIKITAPNLGSKSLRIVYKEVSPGITWQLMFGSELGLAGTVKYTKIREEYPKTDEVLDRSAASSLSDLALCIWGAY